jgi:prolyl-tRNA editing enzyme YbaK/EbsC (Cys-tRNA(Pro) deacylase)
MFLDYIRENGINLEIIDATDSTHTAQDAADYCGCELRCIVKSLLTKIGDEFVLYLVPGNQRLDLNNLSGDGDVRMAKADEVKEVTGYSIGGVPPFGHKNKIRTIIVDGFPSDTKLFAAAGSASTMFSITLKQLEEQVSV